jgi:N-acetyl-anhydromuramyl-L-alanine amidase AmpD
MMTTFELRSIKVNGPLLTTKFDTGVDATKAVVLHWTAGPTLASCRATIGQGGTRLDASCHFAVGRGLAEGIDQYVEPPNGSWHAGRNQLVRDDGAAVKQHADKARARAIGIELVHPGYVLEPDETTTKVATPDGTVINVPPFQPEQLSMLIYLGRELVRRYPHIGPRQWMGHDDICPGYKSDPSCAFPWAKVLSAIYGRTIPNIWAAATVRQRQRCLRDCGFYDGKLDHSWGPLSRAGMQEFQRHEGLAETGYWGVHAAWRMLDQSREAVGWAC